MKRLVLIRLMLTLILGPANAFPQGNVDRLQLEQLRAVRAPGRVLVKYKETVPGDEVANISAIYGLEGLKSYSGSLRRWRLHAVPRYRRTEDVLSALRSEQAIEYAEYDYIYQATANLPNDPNFATQWSLKNTGQSGGVAGTDIKATEAWGVTRGSTDVVIGIIDTGIDYLHPDLATNVWTNPGETPGNNVDDDGDGFVDDVHGWNAIANNGRPADDNAHGTHVAGTVGAIGDNDLGVVGVNWDVRLMALKFLDKNGSGYTSDAIECINFAVTQRNRGVNIKALNASWGGPENSRALQDAIDAAGRAGVLFVVAAGNNGDGSGTAGTDNDRSPIYPAAYNLPNIIAVAAVDRRGNLASFSNYGARSVALGAPGASILSTVPNGAFATFSGTSMAAPHVTGVVGLLAAASPQASSQALRTAILDGGAPLSSLQGKTSTGRFLSASGALSALVADHATNPDFRTVANPDVAALRTDQPLALNLTYSSVNNFSGGLQLSAELRPSSGAISISWSNPNIYLAENQTASTSCTLQASAEAAAGEYLLNLTATAGSLRRTVSIPLTVGNASSLFSLSVSPTTIAVQKGSYGYFFVTIQRSSNHTLPISLQLASRNNSNAVSLLAAFPNPANGNWAVAVLSASTSAQPGNVPLVIRGADTNGAVVESNEFQVQIR